MATPFCGFKDSRGQLFDNEQEALRSDLKSKIYDLLANRFDHCNYEVRQAFNHIASNPLELKNILDRIAALAIAESSLCGEQVVQSALKAPTPWWKKWF